MARSTLEERDAADIPGKARRIRRTARGGVVNIVHVDTAEKLLSALLPSERRWKPDLRAWMFRGQGSTWQLVPRVLRGEVWRRFLQDDRRVKSPQPNDGLRKLAEFMAIAEFMEAADRAGLAIPEDSQHLRSGSLIERFNRDGLWPAPGMLSVLALAQHNGVPTRLLDWTWRPRIAAYFAAEEVVMRDSKPPGDQLAVWACKHRFVTMVGRSRDPSFCMQVVTAPQATNLNLAAQAGVFTLVRDRHEDVPLDAVIAQSLDAGAAKEMLDDLPAMWKLTLPHSEAPRLLRLLGLDGVNAASVFHGYGGVVRSLEEQRRWKP